MPVSIFDENLESKVTLESESNALPDDLPFHILMMGDWGGSSDFSAKPLAERRPIEIDRDEFDSVMRKIAPQVELKFEGNDDNVLRLKFESLDDFHPDNIFQQIPLFSNLKEVRRDLKNPDTFNQAAREVRSWYIDTDAQEQPRQNAQQESSQAVSADSGNLLDQILDNNREEIFTKKTAPKSELSEFIGNIVAPHIVKTDLEEQSKLLMVVDEVVSDLMRKILHHKEFQKLEAAWRGLYFLVRRVETDNFLKISLVQATKDELLESLSSSDDLTETYFYNLVTTKGSWAVVCGNYEFSPIIDDTAALIRIAKISAAGKSPFISQMNPDIFGMKSFADYSDQIKWNVSDTSPEFKLWNALRSIPESSYLGLSMPRFIGRLPYGNETEPAETFAFEEVHQELKHNEYLWLNPSFAYAYIFAQEYATNEWNINRDTAFNIADIPLYMYQSDGDTKTLPCAEIEMTESSYNSILEQGFMTLISFRDNDKLRLSSLRSVSQDGSSLSGKWAD